MADIGLFIHISTRWIYRAVLSFMAFKAEQWCCKVQEISTNTKLLPTYHTY